MMDSESGASDGSFDPASMSQRGPVRSASRRTLRRIRSVLGNDPVFLPIVLRATPRGISRRITESTAIVVEGYPRSGNTFAAAAIRHVGGEDLIVSSHVHTPSQVVLAVRRQVPTLLVIREPMNSVASLVIAAPHVPIELALREWIDHYRRLWPLRDGFVIATFGQTTTNFGSVVARINLRFGLHIPPFTDDDANVGGVQAIMTADHDRFHANDERNAPWPTTSRKAAQRWLMAELASPRYRELLDEANDWYGRYADVADESSDSAKPTSTESATSSGPADSL